MKRSASLNPTNVFNESLKLNLGGQRACMMFIIIILSLFCCEKTLPSSLQKARHGRDMQVILQCTSLGKKDP